MDNDRAMLAWSVRRATRCFGFAGHGVAGGLIENGGATPWNGGWVIFAFDVGDYSRSDEQKT